MSSPQRTVYPVTEGINSPQTKKKYDYYLKCFLKHFDIESQEALLDLKDPRLIEGMILILNRNNLIPTRPYSSVWVSEAQKNGLILKTVQDNNRYISITLEKVLKSAGIEDIEEKELERRLGFNPKKSVRGKVVIAK